MAAGAVAAVNDVVRPGVSPCRQRGSADGMAAGQAAAGALQPGHAARAQAGGKCSSAVRRHRPGWQCGSGRAAAGPLGRGKTRPGEHELPVQGGALCLVRPPCGRGPQGFTMRPTCPCGAITCTSCCQQVGQVEHLIHVLQPMVGQRRCRWLVVANDHVHTQRHTPALRFGTGGGGRQVETGMASELDGHRADTAGSADHQQDPAGGPAANGLEGHAAELRFPGGWGASGWQVDRACSRVAGALAAVRLSPTVVARGCRGGGCHRRDTGSPTSQPCASGPAARMVPAASNPSTRSASPGLGPVQPFKIRRIDRYRLHHSTEAMSGRHARCRNVLCSQRAVSSCGCGQVATICFMTASLNRSGPIVGNPAGGLSRGRTNALNMGAVTYLYGLFIQPASAAGLTAHVMTLLTPPSRIRA